LASFRGVTSRFDVDTSFVIPRGSVLTFFVREEG
jgi:hypothetical protein